MLLVTETPFDAAPLVCNAAAGTSMNDSFSFTFVQPSNTTPAVAGYS